MPKNPEKYRHDCIIHLTKKFKQKNIKRYYPSVAPIVTLDNDYHNLLRNYIKETKKIQTMFYVKY